MNDEDRATLAGWVDDWVKYALRTAQLTDREWVQWEMGARQCYDFIQVPWPDVVVRVSSPIVGLFAAPLASYWLRNKDWWKKKPSATTDRSVRQTAISLLASSYGDDNDPNYLHVLESVVTAIELALGHDADELFLNVSDVSLSTLAYGSENPNVATEIKGVMKEVTEAIHDTIHADTQREVDRMCVVVGNQTQGIRRALSSVPIPWQMHLPGRIDTGGQAYVSFMRDVLKIPLKGDMWDRSRACEAAQSAGWWWPFREVVMVSGPPAGMVTEMVDSQLRLHCEDGPALRWDDGWEIYSWHGTRIPDWVLKEKSVDKAIKLRNTEVRRAAFEAIGWDAVIDHIGVKPVDVAVDPGNPPHKLYLYQLPRDVNPYRRGVNLLLMTNGSPDRSGALRKYGETVPAEITSAVEAAAWQFGVSREVYTLLGRRT
jgi:hypothetical protein